jgi:flagellar motor switch protein FliN/FliY
VANESGGLLDQAEIEALLGSAGLAGSKASAPATPAPTAEPAPSNLPLPKAPQASTTSQAQANVATGLKVRPFELKEAEIGVDAEALDNVALIMDVDLNVRVELGRARMYIADVLRLRPGSIVPLDKLAGDPVDIFVNGQLLARGEVLVLNDNFCIRVSEIVGDEKKDSTAVCEAG